MPTCKQNFIPHQNLTVVMKMQVILCQTSHVNFVALGRQYDTCSSKSHKLNCGQFDTHVIPTLLCGVETWGPSLNKANSQKDLETPSVSMIAYMITSKTSVPHDIIQAQMVAAPIIIKSLFRSVTCIQWLWELLKRRYSRLALYFIHTFC